MLKLAFTFAILSIAVSYPWAQQYDWSLFPSPKGGHLKILCEYRGGFAVLSKGHLYFTMLDASPLVQLSDSSHRDKIVCAIEHNNLLYVLIDEAMEKDSISIWTYNGTSWRKDQEFQYLYMADEGQFFKQGENLFLTGVETYYNNPLYGWQHKSPVDPLSFTTNNSRIFFATSTRGVWASDDTGTTWIASNTGIDSVTAGIPGLEPFNKMAAIGDVILAGGRSEMFRSNDNGESWAIHYVPEHRGLSSTYSAMKNLEGSIYVLNRGVFSVSEDEGISWDNISLPSYLANTNWTENTHPYNFFKLNESFVIQTNAAGLFLGDVGSGEWRPYLGGFEGDESMKLRATEHHLIAGTDRGVFFKNEGVEGGWSQGWTFNNGTVIEPSFLITTASNIYAHLRHSLYRLGDTAWESLQYPREIVGEDRYVSNLVGAGEGDDYWMGVVSTQGGFQSLIFQKLIRFSEPDSIWKEIPIFSLTDTSSIHLFKKSGNRWIGLKTDEKIIVSANGGQNWEVVASGRSVRLARELHFFEPSHLMMLADSGIYFSEDLGQTWQQINGDLPVSAFTYSNPVALVKYHNLAFLMANQSLFYFDWDTRGWLTIEISVSNPQSMAVFEGFVYLSTEREGLYRAEITGPLSVDRDIQNGQKVERPSKRVHYYNLLGQKRKIPAKTRRIPHLVPVPAK